MKRILQLYFCLFVCLIRLSAQTTCGTFKMLASTTSYSSIAQKSDGTIWGWGRNASGQLGLGNATDQNTPQKIGTATTWASISTGSTHTLAVRTDGTLWTWGSDYYGQLGNGTGETNRTTPVQIGSATNWAKVAAGEGFSIAVKKDGTLWAWGYNRWKQLGDGTEVNKESPVQIGTATDWAGVSAGTEHMLAIKTNGTLWSAGNNMAGQLGRGIVDNYASLGQVGTDSDWADISAGAEHSLAIKTNGTLWAWGRNTHGQLGDGTSISRGTPVQVGPATDWTTFSAGGYFSLAVKTNGTLWAWGYNNNGQLGEISNTTFQLSPLQVGTAKDWMTVSAGYDHSLALKKDGTLWAWGSNTFGQVGDNTNTQRNAPIQISSTNTITLATVNSSQTLPMSGITTFYNVPNCNNLIAVVAPQGTTPVTGNTTAKVWIDATASAQFVKRHYEVLPATNANNATGRITLFFTQAEFDAYNALNIKKLPTGPTDEANKANLVIERRPGTSSGGTGLPATYTGTPVNIYPSAANIVWNATASRWEVSFDVIGFGGLFVKSYTSSTTLARPGVSGTVYIDNNGLTGGINNGGTGGGVWSTANSLWVNAVEGGLTIATASVSNAGVFSFPATGNLIEGTTVAFQLSSTAGTLGVAPPAKNLPTGWVTVGESTTSGPSDGSPDGVFTLIIGTTSSANNTTNRFGVTTQADVAIIKTVSHFTPLFGSNVEFILTANNAGPSTAENVSVTDVLPSGYIYVSNTAPSVGTFNSGTGVWTIGSMANGATASLTITATVLTAGNYANTATITSTTTDPNTANNTSTITPIPHDPCAITASNPDSDGDGISDFCDLDDDNDGILDVIECPSINNSPIFHLFDAEGANSENFLSLYKQENGIGSTFICPTNNCSTNPNGALYKEVNVQGNVTNLAYDDGKFYTINNAGELLFTDNIATGFFQNLGSAHTGSFRNLAYDNGIFYHWKNTGTAIQLYATTNPLANNWALVGTINSKELSFIQGAYTYELKDIAVNKGVFYFMYYNISVPNITNNLRTIVYSSTAPTSSTPNWQNLGSTYFGLDVFNIAIGSEHMYQSCDTDGDGIPNHLDVDSDGDGCFDAIEGDENVLAAHINGAGRITGGVNANGVPSLVNSGGTADIGSDQGQGAGQAYIVNVAPITPVVTTTAATCAAEGTATISNYNAALTYTFSPAGPTVAAGGVISNATPGITYSVTSTSAGGCVSASTSFTRQPKLAAAVAGVASSDQTINSGTVANNLTLTGSSGTIQWQVSTDEVTFSNVPTAGTSATYAPGVLTATRYYRAVVTSGGGCVATSNFVTITVNNPPVAVNDSYPTHENGPVNIMPLENDSDPDGNTISISSISGVALTGADQTITVTNGTVNVAANGNITFTPAANYTGTVNFPYVISDGNATATANIQVIVNAPLPVKLSHFNIVKSGSNNALLNWSTSMEHNNKGFTVQRSNNGIDWVSINFVPSINDNGISNVPLHYSFADHSAPDGINYYRLQQVDLDGKFEYSTVKKIVLSGQLPVTIYPNPASDYIWINGLSGNETIRIMDITGRLIWQQKAEGKRLQLFLTHFPDGAYNVIISEGRNLKSLLKFVILK